MMSSLNEQQREIEALRLRLHELVLAKRENLADPEVAELSALLDNLIVKFEKTKAENKAKEAFPWR